MNTPSPHPAADACPRLRTALLSLHRTLVDLERRDYEKHHGQQSAGQFLQLMAYGESMRWLEPLSRLIVLLDEAIDPKSAIDMAPSVVAQRVRELLHEIPEDKVLEWFDLVENDALVILDEMQNF